MIPEWVPIFGVFLVSLNQHSANYASLAAHATRFAGPSRSARRPRGFQSFKRALSVCPSARAGSPEPRHRIGIEDRIGRDQFDVFGQSLGRQQPVEWISVVEGEVLNGQGM